MFSLEFLATLRSHELDVAVAHLRPGARVLELGAGTGQQAAELAARGFDVIALDVGDSDYASERVFPVIDFDGRNLPVENASVDVVFSSNTLEHVRDLRGLHEEIRRVLRPEGYCVHILPTHAWRAWTLISQVPASFALIRPLISRLAKRPPDDRLPTWIRSAPTWKLALRVAVPFLQRRHGERGNVLSEVWTFHPRWWRRFFRSQGFDVLEDHPIGLFYTGNMVAGSHVSLPKREAAARVLGSACHLFKVRPAPM